MAPCVLILPIYESKRSDVHFDCFFSGEIILVTIRQEVIGRPQSRSAALERIESSCTSWEWSKHFCVPPARVTVIIMTRDCNDTITIRTETSLNCNNISDTIYIPAKYYSTLFSGHI